MRLQMQLPKPSADSLIKLWSFSQTQLKKRIDQFNKERPQKMTLAAAKNDQKAITNINKMQKALAEQNSLLTETNLIRVAVALGLKEMSKWTVDEVLTSLEKHGVVKGRPRGE